MDAAVEQAKLEHSSWIKCILRIGREQTFQFENACEAYVTDLIVCNSRRQMMMWIYQDLVKAKRLLPIESYDQETKNRMWVNVKEFIGGRTTDKDKIIEVCKVMYLIEFFIHERC